MAIAMALVGIHPSLWFTDWLITDFFYKIIVGVLVGLCAGWLISKIIYSVSQTKDHHSTLSIGLLALSLTLFPYGLAELLHSYGFIAVFIAACMHKQQETSFEYLEILHDFSEEMERTMVVVLFTLIGIYISNDYFVDFQWYMFPASIVILAIIRPIAGIIGLIGSGLPRAKKYIISFYGIRGIGSVYYLLYAFYHADFDQSNEVLALVTTVIILSVFIHGLSARSVLKKWLPE
jgi:NhaP-type Na+/H+ or K+/H+ antiporter